MSWNPNVTKHLANPNHCQPLSEPKEIIQFVLDIDKMSCRVQPWTGSNNRGADRTGGPRHARCLGDQRHDSGDDTYPPTCYYILPPAYVQ